MFIRSLFQFLKFPTPVLGVPPSIIGVNSERHAATSVVTVAHSTVTALASKKLATPKTKTATNGGKGKKTTKSKATPVLPRAKKLGKTMGAEPKSAFRSLYNDVDVGNSSFRPLDTDGTRKAKTPGESVKALAADVKLPR